MKSVASVSGGKSSAMMAVESPSDYYLFSCVLTEQKEAQPKDPGLLRRCQKKIPSFIASRELDQTLKNMFDLEQLLGKEIVWVHGRTYDQLIRDYQMLPNRMMRFCTEQLKIHPIFNYCYNYIMDDEEDTLFFKIGLRTDEMNRAEKLGNCKYEKIKFSDRCDLEGQYKNKHRWREISYRMLNFPLIEMGVDSLDVAKYWRDKGWDFPVVSNCDFCFFHKPAQQEYQYKHYPERAQWWIDKEKEIGATFLKNTSYEQAFSTQQLALFPDDEASCMCTD